MNGGGGAGSFPDKVDEARRRGFELARLQGEAPLEDYLPKPDADTYAATLEELVCIDLELGWREAGGDGPQLEGYLERFPELRAPEVRTRLEAELAAVRERFRGARALPLPRDFGRFRVTAELGRGAFARVYRAEDPQLEREVALKVLREEHLDDAPTVERFWREAKSAARLRHPGIAPVHEVAEVEGRPVIVTDYAAGPSLHEQLERGPFTPRRAADVVAKVAEALHYAHQFGVVHRDVKPANILTTGDGQPLVTDFGLALQSTAGSSLTGHGDLLGTPAYMAPEQVREAGEVDARSDVYSLGVVLYQLLTGRLPFEGSWSQVLRRVLEEEPVRPRKHRPDVPVELETVCLKALAKEPGRRYSSASLMAEDLRRFLDHEPVLARRAGPAERAALWIRRNPSLAGTAAVAALLVLLTAGVGLQRVLHERNRFRAERDLAQSNLYTSLLGEARAWAQVRDSGWWWDGMQNVREAAALDVDVRDVDELRSVAMRYLANTSPCFRVHSEWEAHGELVGIACDPLGRHCAVLSGEGEVALFRLPDGEPLGRLRLPSPCSELAYHPRGGLLACAGEDGVVRVLDLGPPDRARLTEVATLEPGAGALTALAAAPDGSRLAVGTEDGSVVWFDGWTAEARRRVATRHGGAVAAVAFDPEGRRLGSCAEDKTVQVVDLEAGEVESLWNTRDEPAGVALVGDHLVVAEPANYGFARYRQGEMQHSGSNLLHKGGVVRLRTRGEYLFTGSTDGSVKAWPARHGFTELGVAARDLPRVQDFDLDQDGRWIAAAYLDGFVRVWEVSSSTARADFTRLGTHHDAEFIDDERLVNPTHAIDLGDERHAQLGYRPPPIHCLARGEEPGSLGFGTHEGQLCLLSPGAELERVQVHAGPVLALAHRAGTWVSGAQDGSLVTWAGDGRRRELAWDLGAVQSVDVSVDGSRAVVAGLGGVGIALLPAGEVQVLQCPDAALSRLALFAAGRVIAACDDGRLAVFDLGGRHLVTLEAHAGALTALARTESGERFYSAGADKRLLTWNSRELKIENQLELPSSADEAYWIQPDEDGDTLLVGMNVGVSVWDVRPPVRIASIDSHATCGLFVDGGETFYLSTATGTIQAFSTSELRAEVERRREALGDLAPHSPLRVFARRNLVAGGHNHAVWGLAAHRGTRRFATCDHLGEVKVWDGDSLKRVWTQWGHEEPVWCVAFDEDGARLASTSLREAKVWDAETGELLNRIEGHERLITSACFVRSGDWLATCSLDGALKLFDIESGRELATLADHDTPIHQLALSPDRALLAAACHDRRVLVWELDGVVRAVAAGAEPPAPRVLEGHPAPVWTVTFRPDGRELASGDESGNLVLWEVPGFRRGPRLRGEQVVLRNLSYSSSGRRLSVASLSTPIVVWDLESLREKFADLGLAW